ARGPMGDEHVDVEPKELLGQYRQPVVIALRPSELDDEIATFDPAEIAKSGAKRRNATCVTGRGHQTEKADTSDLGRLRPRREWTCRRAAEKRDEVAARDSITSSARASSVGGRSSPSAFAVVRLMVRSNLVGCSTGMSAGLAPRRTLSISLTMGAVRFVPQLIRPRL